MDIYGATNITWLVIALAMGFGLYRIIRLLTDIRDRLNEMARRQAIRRAGVDSDERRW